LRFVFLLGLMITAFVLIKGFVPRRVDRRRSAWKPWAPVKGIEASAPQGDSWARASVCIAIGAVVPIVAFAFTWLAFQTSRVDGVIWQIPLIITLVCVVVASLLARSLFNSGRRTMIRDESKPSIDEDAFDVVSRRG
jgi:hypothetical protein